MNTKLQFSITLCLLFCVIPSGWAQSRFQASSLVNSFTSSTSLFTTDLDLDGDMDFLAGSGAQGVYWFENLGGKPAAFSSHVIDPSIRKCFTVVAGDLDLDGKPDVIAGSWEQHDIIWYRIQPDGTWSPTIIDINLTNVHEVFIQDIDRDSRPDILAAGAGVDQVAWYRNDLSGSWTKNIVSSNFGGVRSVAAADLDGDGDIDIAGGASDDHDVAVWINQGGVPIQWSRVTVADQFTGSHRIQIVDLNLDGRPDILGAAWGVNEVSWWENTGNSPDQWPKHVIDNDLALSLTALAADFDRDGDLDIAATGIGDRVAWYENQQGDCSQWRKKVLDQQLGSPWPLIAADFDGDKDLDLIAGGDAGNQIKLYTNNREGIFSGCIATPEGNFPIGLYLPPESNAVSENPALLIALPGAAESREYLMLRDALIPAGESQCMTILTIDYPRAEAPDYRWPDYSVLPTILDFARQGFAVSHERIYVLGLGPQGKPVVAAATSDIPSIRGFIGFNPQIPRFSPDEWTDLTVPAVVAIRDGHPDRSEVQNLADHYESRKPSVSILSYPGSDEEYPFDEVSDLVIQCIGLLENAYTLGRNDTDRPFPDASLNLDFIFQDGCPVCVITGTMPGNASLSVLDLSGKPCFHQSIRTEAGTTYVPVNGIFPARSKGLYLIRIRDQKGRTACKAILWNQ